MPWLIQRLIILLGPLIVFMALPACSTTPKTHMQQEKLMQLLSDNKAPIIIDVRSQGEYDAGHVPGALHIPFWSAYKPQRLTGVDPNELLVVYCQHGPRAGIAKLALSLTGFENIVYLQGHMRAWQQANLPTQASPPESE